MIGVFSEHFHVVLLMPTTNQLDDLRQSDLFSVKFNARLLLCHQFGKNKTVLFELFDIKLEKTTFQFLCLLFQDVAIAAMGPIQGLPDYNWFRRRTYMLRY